MQQINHNLNLHLVLIPVLLCGFKSYSSAKISTHIISMIFIYYYVGSDTTKVLLSHYHKKNKSFNWVTSYQKHVKIVCMSFTRDIDLKYFTYVTKNMYRHCVYIHQDTFANID